MIIFIIPHGIHIVTVPRHEDLSEPVVFSLFFFCSRHYYVSTVINLGRYRHAVPPKQTVLTPPQQSSAIKKRWAFKALTFFPIPTIAFNLIILTRCC